MQLSSSCGRAAAGGQRQRQQQQRWRPAAAAAPPGSSLAAAIGQQQQLATAAALPKACMHQQQHHHHRATVACRAAADSDELASSASALERRRLREARRAARQQDAGSDDDDDDDEEEDAAAETTAAAAGGRMQPGSRLAARRAARARQRGAGGAQRPRVPAALVPDDVDAAAAGSDDDDNGGDDEEGAAGDWDYTFDRASSASLASEEEEQQQLLASDQDGASGGEQLPQSVLQQAAGGRGNQRQQQQRGDKRQQQQQQRGGAPELVELPEASPMYLPVLTDEDLAADPPGHKSGYAAVIGRPNAGKSTLINAIVGQKLSIVTFKPQTTRHRVVGIASDTAYQMILFDTPGIMNEQRSKLDERMMAAVVSSIKAAEAIIAVVDASDDPQDALAMFQPGPDWTGPPMAVLINKADLLAEEQVDELAAWYREHCRAEAVFVGRALEGGGDAGVQAVKAWAVDKLPEGPTLYPKSMVSEQPERFFVSEIIREQIFLQYSMEVPYACQVQITDFRERRGAKDYVEAVILVERESQAPIVLGRGGAAIKALGSAARAQIEEFLGRKVFLQLSVQVAPAWRQQPDKLKDYGYYDPLYVS